MTVKHLGLDILNLFPDLENNEPREDGDGPSFPKLDDELKDAEASRDVLVNSDVVLHVGNAQECARVLRHKRDPDRNLVGSARANPAVNTCIYKVRFSNGRTEQLDANVLAEVVYAQCQSDGNQYVLLDAIVDYCKDPPLAVSQSDYVMVVDGKKIVKCSTKGWELCCKWKDGSTS